jgi:hypothetical protein
MCRWVILSWPVYQKNINGNYLILGELLNKKTTYIVKDIMKDLKFLYPFKYDKSKNLCHNEEDFIFLQTKYNLSFKKKLVGNFNDNIILFHTPILYDLDCQIKISKHIFSNKLVYNPKKNICCIVMPYSDPILRGNIVKEVIKYGADTIVLSQNFYGLNKTSTYKLYSNMFTKYGFSKKNILKIPEPFLDLSFLIEIINIVNISMENVNFVIACSNFDIQKIGFFVRYMRKQNKILQKIRYIVC